MPDLAHTLLVTFAVIVSIMSVLWLVSLARRDASIIDSVWGTGFAIVAFVAYLSQAAASLRMMILVCLVTAWGLRLSLFLSWRNWGKPEDYRYAAMRAYHGKRFWWVSLLTVFLLQGLILWFVSFPIQFATVINDPQPLGWMDGVGIAVWAIGLFFETAGDWQLARFKADPANAGKVMDRGVWRYTRHPNYFGDFCVWWGLYIVAACGGAGWTFCSPLLMSFLLIKVSGVALLESTITDRRPEYAAYKARTNAFLPGLPKTSR